MTLSILLLPLFLLSVAAVFDLRSREIPNWISLGLVLIAIVAMLFGLASIRWWMVLLGGGLGLAIGAALFHSAQFGGGDAKLIAGLGALLGPVGLLFALFWMALAGGLLALIAVIRGQRDYAYGPAIALGYLAYLIWPVGLMGHFLNSTLP